MPEVVLRLTLTDIEYSNIKNACHGTPIEDFAKKAMITRTAIIIKNRKVSKYEAEILRIKNELSQQNPSMTITPSMIRVRMVRKTNLHTIQRIIEENP